MIFWWLVINKLTWKPSSSPKLQNSKINDFSRKWQENLFLLNFNASSHRCVHMRVRVCVTQPATQTRILPYGKATAIRSGPTEPLPVSSILCLDMQSGCVHCRVPSETRQWARGCWFNHAVRQIHTHTHTCSALPALKHEGFDSSSCLDFLHWCCHRVVVSSVCVCACMCGLSLCPPCLTLGVCTHLFSQLVHQASDGPDCRCSLTAAVSVPAASSAQWQLDFFLPSGKWQTSEKN